MRPVSSVEGTSLTGPVAAVAGTVRGSSWDQTGAPASRINPNPTHPQQIELRFLMVTKRSLRNNDRIPRLQLNVLGRTIEVSHGHGMSLRNNDRVPRLQLNVLGRTLGFDDFLVVERNPGLAAVGILPQNVNGFLLGEITEATGQRNRVQHRRRIRDHMRSRSCRLSQNVEFLAVDLLNHDRNFRLRNKTLQLAGDIFFQLQGG